VSRIDERSMGEPRVDKSETGEPEMGKPEMGEPEMGEPGPDGPTTGERATEERGSDERGIGARKSAHLELCIGEDVESRNGTLLDEVHLFHEALPELSWDEVDPSLEVFGRRLQAPILISGMSGGAEEARELNRALASAAHKLGLGMGVGSQRAMLLDPASADTYRVREVAPDILLLANLGAVQARDAGPARVARLASEIGADALCIHLNPAQELVQDEGDRRLSGHGYLRAEFLPQSGFRSPSDA
jgi:isopentenyl diphosphate isomerase/L-lactate dehydrogenase-like FMN-dependent dehydrogenase